MRPLNLILLALIFAVQSASAANQTNSAVISTRRTETGFLRLFEVRGQLAGTLQMPRASLLRRFAANLDLAQVGLRLRQDMSVVVDGKPCQIQLSPVTTQTSAALWQWQLQSDCPVSATRLDAHFSPFGQAQPQYRTLVTWINHDSIQHAMSTADEACVAFFAQTDWSQLADLTLMRHWFADQASPATPFVYATRTAKPVHSGQ